MSDAVIGLEAVEAVVPGHAALEVLRELATRVKWDRGELTVTVLPEKIVAAAAAVKAAGYNFFEDCTAVDWFPSEPRFQVSYHIVSHARKQRLRLAVMVSGEDPSVPSTTLVWPSANFYEREVFDLFGVRFAGHPNLTRIMMPVDWVGHPMRKNYPVEGYR